MRSRPHIVPICVAIVGVLLLRALIPIGYMPASAGSGLLFELCFDSLSVGTSFASSAHEHHHHHHHTESENASSDACDFGHLLTNVWIDSPVYAAAFDETGIGFDRTAIYQSVMLIVRRVYASRAPPVL